MESKKLYIKGSAGERNLSGEISVSGSKNCSFPLLASSILFDSQIKYRNLSNATDVKNVLEWMKGNGFSVETTEDACSIKISDTYNPESNTLTPTESMRGHIVFVGPLLARFGRISFEHPGGCTIGERPIDIFINFFKEFGAKVKTSNKESTYELHIPDKLCGIEYVFNRITVTGTITCALTATLAEGDTVLYNCATEPEVTHTLKFLREQGFEIEGIGTRILRIKGRSGKLMKKSEEIEVFNLFDRIQMISYLILGILLGSDLLIKNVDTNHIKSILVYLKRIGIDTFEVKEDSIFIKKSNKTLDLSKLEPIYVVTREYPYIPTDVQTLISVFATQLGGDTLVKDSIYENRIRKQFEQLKKFGADVEVLSDSIGLVKGPSKLSRTKIKALDLRSDFSMLVAALLAEGESELEDTKFIDRGYENLVESLKKIGANLESR